MKVFFALAVAGLLALRFSPWFWNHATVTDRASVIVAVVAVAAVVAGIGAALRPKRRRRQSRQQPTGYSYPRQ